MSKDRPIYVIDTNILVDYVDVIPGEEGKQPLEPTIDLSQAHIVIPTVVVRELSNFKGEGSDRGKAARVVLRRLRKLFEGDVHTMGEIYNLKAPITVKLPGHDEDELTEEESETTQLISILPVHKNFRESLPFNPSDRDMDGQIILTALAASLADRGKGIDGQELKGAINSFSFDNVVLLTNDNGLAIRARERGLATSRYGYKYPDPYTGRRDIEVPRELLEELLNCRAKEYGKAGVSREMFEELMPNEPGLVANEFIVMYLPESEPLPVGYDPENDPYFTNIGRYDLDEDAIVPLRYVSDFPTTVDNPGQAIYAESLMHPDIDAVICTGPAGSGKTYMATIFGFKACQEGKYIGVTAVPCENRSNIGALPGDLDEKMDPDVQPLKNALRNYLLRKDKKLSKELENLQKHGPEKAKSKRSKAEAETNGNENSANGGGNGNGNGNGNSGNGSNKRSLKSRLKDHVDLIWDNWFSSVPIDSARGRDFAYEIAIYDEFQDQNASQADTLIKRIGSEGKIILTGDIEQIHAPYLDRENNGLVYASRQLFDNPRVAQVCFTEEEVVRHPLVQEIARRQKAEKSQLSQH